MIYVVINICCIAKRRVVSSKARLSGNKPLTKSDAEDECTDAETDISNHDTEEDGETYACEHLSDTSLIVVVAERILILLQQLVGYRLSFLHCHLCQFDPVPAVLVDEVEHGYNDQYRCKDEDDENNNGSEKHACYRSLVEITEYLSQYTIHIIVAGVTDV